MILLARYFSYCFLEQRRSKIKTPLEREHVRVRGMNTLFRAMRGSFLGSNREMKPLPISEARRKRFHSIAVVPYSTMELLPSADLRLPCSPLVAAAMAPKAVPSAATTLRPLPWCPSTSKAQLLLPWTAQALRPLVVDDRRRQPPASVTPTMRIDNGKMLCLRGRRASEDTPRGYDNRRHSI